ncbi:RusA family crossover junction endodeoxyribonuclease [Spirillospora sp. CA-128828]|uniref:RusA family crossover junction endodeoxyribonuclease n=1 Tax=Spirillospora sp. CA-128828 TaxID=3240033 RepID=UPI003D8D9D41
MTAMATVLNLDPSRPTVKITAIGTPAPQGSKRHVGRGVMVESSKKVKPWREAVKSAALDFISDADQYGRQIGRLTDGFPLDGPLFAHMAFTLARPKSAPKSRLYPDRMPDLSKLVRATEDALTDAGVWADDARVVSTLARKLYPHPFSSDPDALAMPGAVIRIWTIQ